VPEGPNLTKCLTLPIALLRLRNALEKANSKGGSIAEGRLLD